jgi:hypothetical protein
MPFGRRRPLMRAAAVGGVAYTASRRGAMAGQRQAEEQEPEAQAPPEAEEAPPEAAPPAADSEDSTVARIEQLAKLHESGVLTDEEFSAAKAKALGIA